MRMENPHLEWWSVLLNELGHLSHPLPDRFFHALILLSSLLCRGSECVEKRMQELVMSSYLLTSVLLVRAELIIFWQEQVELGATEEVPDVLDHELSLTLALNLSELGGQTQLPELFGSCSETLTNQIQSLTKRWNTRHDITLCEPEAARSLRYLFLDHRSIATLNVEKFNVRALSECLRDAPLPPFSHRS